MKAQIFREALERIVNHEYRADRRCPGMVDIEEIQTLQRIARIALARSSAPTLGKADKCAGKSVKCAKP